MWAELSPKAKSLQEYRIIEKRYRPAAWTVSHVAPGIQQTAAESFDKLLNRDNQNEISSKLVASS